MTQARAGLRPEAFKILNRFIVRLFYSNSKIKTWKGFRILAVDGSTLQLPGNHKSLKNKFSYHLFGPKADSGRWMSRISYLYDVFNGLVLDAQMESFRTSESALCKKHIPFIKKGDLVLFDRYYASLELIFHLTAKGSHFVFRMKDNWWKCVESFVNSSAKEQLVELRLPEKNLGMLVKYPHLKETIKVRLVKKRDKKGKIQVYCTSLLESERYSAKSIINLYKERWGIEEAYKLIKSRLEVADFSGLTAWAIQQDFYAKTMLISLNSIMCHGISPGEAKKKKRNSTEKNQPERIRVINRTYALAKLKEILKKTVSDLNQLTDLFKDFYEKVRKRIEYSRKYQYIERRFKANTKYSMSYKGF